MLDWSERQLERGIESLQLALLRRAQPDLRQVGSRKDQQWALWFVLRSLSWLERLVIVAMMLIIGPLTAISAIAVAFNLFGALDWAWLFLIVLVGAPIGFTLAGRIAQVLIRGRVQSTTLHALRLSGHDVCPECGYDMRGHRPAVADDAVCPECGLAVPVPMTARRAA